MSLMSDGRNHFTHAHDSAEPYKKDETNPYVEAFYKWWESDLHKTLDELRITGGEPMMSPNLWRLLDWIETQGDKMRPGMRIAINSNLGAKQDIIDRFKNKLKNFVEILKSLKDSFKDRLYIEVQRHNENQEKNFENYKKSGKIYVNNIEKIVETLLSIIDLLKLVLTNNNDDNIDHDHYLINEEIKLDERI